MLHLSFDSANNLKKYFNEKRTGNQFLPFAVEEKKPLVPGLSLLHF